MMTINDAKSLSLIKRFILHLSSITLLMPCH